MPNDHNGYNRNRGSEDTISLRTQREHGSGDRKPGRCHAARYGRLLSGDRPKFLCTMASNRTRRVKGNSGLSPKV